MSPKSRSGRAARPERRARRRRLQLERLEDRSLLAADSAPYQNLVQPGDVNHDGVVNAGDISELIRDLRTNGQRDLRAAAGSSGSSGGPQAEGEAAGARGAAAAMYVDVNGDNRLDLQDAIQLMSWLRSGPPSRPSLVLAEGEAAPPAQSGADIAATQITENEVAILLARAAGATKSNNAIIAIVDRGGRILGVRAESDVVAQLTAIADPTARNLATTFFVDGAVAKARTAAFFASNAAPLTSRTIRNLSQSTITEREVEGNPTIPNPLDAAQNPFVDANPISRTYGPGYVAPIGVGGHFPAGVTHTPVVDLFAIEHQSRDGLRRHGLDGIKGTADDIILANRFNVFDDPGDPADDVANLLAPESYGVQSGLVPWAVGRGIATLPGGIPLFKKGVLVGGIGVFFPGPDGYATHEQGFVPGVQQSEAARLNAPKVLEAEFIAFAAAGGSSKAPGGGAVGTIAGVPKPTGYDLPFGRIDLVGLTLEVYGPNPTRGQTAPGFRRLLNVGASLGQGDPNSGDNLPVLPSADELLPGEPVPDGWLVPARNSTVQPDLTAAVVTQIINRAVNQATLTRAAIRLPLGSQTRMVIAVADTGGNVLGLFRMPDATVFSIDVAVAKARNTAYYADAAEVQAIDLVGLSTTQNGAVALRPGVAFTNRTFRFLAAPRFPSGVDGSVPPAFSILNDPGVNRSNISFYQRSTGQFVTSNGAENLDQANPTPAGQFQTVLGFDSFNPGRNFRDPLNLGNQNGVVFFPGSTPLYVGLNLRGGLGVSGDGVDQDDVVTAAAQVGFAAPQALRADSYFHRRVRLPFQKFNRNPGGF